MIILPDTTPKPGKRDYTWTVDTLSYPGSFQTLMRDIWASSPKDVYVVGHNDQNRGQMYHYDGVRWSAVRLAISDGGNIAGGFDFSAIYGFSPTNVYAVGKRIYINPSPPPNFLDSSLIIHYDGRQWREVSTGIRGRYLTSVWGASPSDVWFGGGWGTLYHYDGVSTRSIKFDSLTGFDYFAGFSISNVYASGSKKIDFASPEDSSLYLLYHYDGKNWTPVDSFLISLSNLSSKFGLSLWASEKGKLYSATYGVYVLEGQTWRQLVSSYWPTRMGASSEENMFAVGGLGTVFHWNGYDWKDLSGTLGTSHFVGIWTDNTETFIVGHDGRKTYIIHGR